MALLNDLGQLPPKVIPYKGIMLKEFDLDAARKRHPQIVLVDELAHSNAAGCRHTKRYQDVEELLRAAVQGVLTGGQNRLIQEILPGVLPEILAEVIRIRMMNLGIWMNMMKKIWDLIKKPGEIIPRYMERRAAWTN